MEPLEVQVLQQVVGLLVELLVLTATTALAGAQAVALLGGGAGRLLPAGGAGLRHGFLSLRIS